MSAVCIVYIGASWCGTCKTIKPQLLELCRKFQADFTELDYDADLDDDEKESIQKVPTIRIRQGGAQVAEFNQRQVAQTEAWLRENMGLAPTDDF